MGRKAIVQQADVDAALRSAGHKERAALAESLVNAAAELFERKGYSSTSVQDVVDRVGVTKGGFYHHFKSKDDLLFDIHDRFITWQLDSAATIVDRQLPPAETLHELVKDLMRAIDLYRSWIGTFIREHRYLAEHERYDEIRTKRDALSNVIVSTIDAGIVEGSFRAMSADEVKVAAFGIIGMTAWATEWYQPGSRMSALEIGDVYGRMVVSGLAT